MPLDRVTRIDNIDRVRKAYIMWEGIPVAELYHEFSSLSGEFDWVIKPIWANWGICVKKGWVAGIGGIDETLHLDEYIRRYNPYFVTQRTMPEGRPEIPQLLEDLHLNYYDLFEVLCRTHGICGNDDLYVSRTPDKYIDVDQLRIPYEIPNFDTDSYGWLNKKMQALIKHEE